MTNKERLQLARGIKTKDTPFYVRANGAVKCREVQDGYSLTVHYGNRVLTSYFVGLVDMAEYIYYTSANESETQMSIQDELIQAYKNH